MHAAAGTDFVVPLNSQTKDPLRLTWSRDDSIIFRRRGNDVHTGKADDVDENGSLRLKNLTVSQSGTYKPEVVSKTGEAEENLKTIRLCVIAPVPKPEVSVMCEGSEVTFTCTVPEKDLTQKTDITVAWYQNDNVNDEMKDWSVTFEAEKVENDHFRCNISNLVSCAVSDPVQQTCYEPYEYDNFGDYIEFFCGAVTEDPDGDNTEELLGEGNGISSSIWVFVSSGVGIVLALWC